LDRSQHSDARHRAPLFTWPLQKITSPATTFFAKWTSPSDSPVTVTLPQFSVPQRTPPPLNCTSQSPFSSATPGKFAPPLNVTMTFSPGLALPFRKDRAPYSLFTWKTIPSPNHIGSSTLAATVVTVAQSAATRKAAGAHIARLTGRARAGCSSSSTFYGDGPLTFRARRFDSPGFAPGQSGTVRGNEEEGEIHSEITTGKYKNFSRHASA
jgi:hypothetical protein